MRVDRQSISANTIEIGIAFFVVCGLSFMFIYLDVFEWWHDVTRHHEAWQLDEFFAILVATLIAGTALAIRHVHILNSLMNDLEAAHAHIAAQEKLRSRQEKMSALGELSGGMAHEINNALQPALGLGDLVKDGLEESGNSKHLGYMELILDSARHAHNIIENVLDYTREKKIEMARYDAFDVIFEALNFSEAIMPSMIVFDIDTPDENDVHGLLLECNKTSLIQVFTNVLKNAASAMDDKGTIRIMINRTIVPDRNGVLGICISITDTGCGMDKKLLKKIFDPFFTTKNASEGTGLGLSTAQGIVKSHGGQISVTSTPGQGSTFTLIFPVMLNTTKLTANWGDEDVRIVS